LLRCVDITISGSVLGQRKVQAERRASECRLEFEQVSKLVKQETARFERERIDDFKDSLHLFLEGMITRQKEVILVLWVSTRTRLTGILSLADFHVGELSANAAQEYRKSTGPHPCPEFMSGVDAGSDRGSSIYRKLLL
jgi:hypothetical protein